MIERFEASYDLNRHTNIIQCLYFRDLEPTLCSRPPTPGNRTQPRAMLVHGIKIINQSNQIKRRTVTRRTSRPCDTHRIYDEPSISGAYSGHVPSNR